MWKSIGAFVYPMSLDGRVAVGCGVWGLRCVFHGAVLSRLSSVVWCGVVWCGVVWAMLDSLELCGMVSSHALLSSCV